MANIKINKNLLIEQHVKQGKSVVEISNEFGFTPSGVRRAIQRFGLKYTKSKTGTAPINRIGLKYGSYIVMAEKGRNSCGNSIWQCRCLKCGTIRNMGIGGLNRSLKEKRDCRNCRIKSCGEIHLRYLKNMKRKAKSRKLCWSLSPEYLWELFLKQNRKCIFTGVELVFAKNYRSHKEQTASLDRIDSSKGYIKGNVQWVDKTINFMKQALTDENFIDLCRKVVQHAGDKPKGISPKNT